MEHVSLFCIDDGDLSCVGICPNVRLSVDMAIFIPTRYHSYYASQYHTLLLYNYKLSIWSRFYESAQQR